MLGHSLAAETRHAAARITREAEEVGQRMYYDGDKLESNRPAGIRLVARPPDQDEIAVSLTKGISILC